MTLKFSSKFSDYNKQILWNWRIRIWNFGLFWTRQWFYWTTAIIY